MPTLRIATYNIHRCRGLDGRTSPGRIADVIRGINADIVALQEVVGAGPSSAGHAEEIGALLGMGWAMAPTRHLRHALFGNVVLSRLPILHHTQYDLSWKTCEPRCCQRVDIDVGGHTLHLYNVHLGTAIRERRYQAGRLSAIVHDRRVDQPKIVLGDFNEWMRGLATQMLSERLGSIDLRAHLRRRRTYPGVFPVLHLDHIYYEGKVEVAGLELPRTRLALLASDHLPLVADLNVEFT
ncbi:MAG: endonuclease/exonuclease/phosphatase family protein [Acidobacteria bacterium]|nr:endonuclease/exonuclease/phosphatase family protein [Acidobacteriota bacterium]